MSIVESESSRDYNKKGMNESKYLLPISWFSRMIFLIKAKAFCCTSFLPLPFILRACSAMGMSSLILL